MKTQGKAPPNGLLLYLYLETHSYFNFINVSVYF